MPACCTPLLDKRGWTFPYLLDVKPSPFCLFACGERLSWHPPPPHTVPGPQVGKRGRVCHVCGCDIVFTALAAPGCSTAGRAPSGRSSAVATSATPASTACSSPTCTAITCSDCQACCALCCRRSCPDRIPRLAGPAAIIATPLRPPQRQRRRRPAGTHTTARSCTCTARTVSRGSLPTRFAIH